MRERLARVHESTSYACRRCSTLRCRAVAAAAPALASSRRSKACKTSTYSKIQCREAIINRSCLTWVILWPFVRRFFLRRFVGVSLFAFFMHFLIFACFCSPHFGAETEQLFSAALEPQGLRRFCFDRSKERAPRKGRELTPEKHARAQANLETQKITVEYDGTDVPTMLAALERATASSSSCVSRKGGGEALACGFASAHAFSLSLSLSLRREPNERKI